MNLIQAPYKSLFALLAMTAMATVTIGAVQHKTHRSGEADGLSGTAVSGPWVFENGNETSRSTAIKTTDEIMRRAGYSAIPMRTSQKAWGDDNQIETYNDEMPSTRALAAFGRQMGAQVVLYGSVSWNTRSIWVNLGPKTISTAKVDVYVFDVASEKVVFENKGIEGRSDEKSNGYKIAADVLLTPLVTVVSGGPSTPHEQRAVQIALGKAYREWTHSDRTTH